MKMYVCSIYDQAAKAFSRPMFVAQVGMAIRAFQDEVNNVKSPMHAHPDQYVLFEIGTFDDNSGKFESIDPLSHGNGVMYKNTVSVMINADTVFEQLRILTAKVEDLIK